MICGWNVRETAGAAVHVRTRAGDWLFDCGPERDFNRLVCGYLRSRGINHLDGLVLTHGDSAHIGAAAAVSRAFHPQIIRHPRHLIARQFTAG